jgi:hypothetical protein
VIHIEHGIRGASSIADAEFVAHLAATFALPFHIHHADVPAMDGNLEPAETVLHRVNSTSSNAVS